MRSFSIQNQTMQVVHKPAQWLFQPRRFFIATVIILGLTAVAKIYSLALGSVSRSPDPILFLLSQRTLVLIATLAELTVIAVVVCQWFKNETKAVCVLALASCLLAYRIGLVQFGIHGCRCVGTIPESSLWSAVLWTALLYLLAGSLWGLRAAAAFRE